MAQVDDTKPANQLAAEGRGWFWPAGRTWWGEPLPTRASPDAGWWNQDTSCRLTVGIESLRAAIRESVSRQDRWAAKMSRLIARGEMRAAGRHGLIVIEPGDVKDRHLAEAHALADFLHGLVGIDIVQATRDDRAVGQIMDATPYLGHDLRRLVPPGWAGSGAIARDGSWLRVASS